MKYNSIGNIKYNQLKTDLEIDCCKDKPVWVEINCWKPLEYFLKSGNYDEEEEEEEQVKKEKQ